MKSIYGKAMLVFALATQLFTTVSPAITEKTVEGAAEDVAARSNVLDMPNPFAVDSDAPTAEEMDDDEDEEKDEALIGMPNPFAEKAPEGDAPGEGDVKPPVSEAPHATGLVAPKHATGLIVPKEKIQENMIDKIDKFSNGEFKKTMDEMAKARLELLKQRTKLKELQVKLNKMKIDYAEANPEEWKKWSGRGGMMRPIRVGPFKKRMKVR